MVIKLGKELSSDKRVSFTNSYNLLITRSHDKKSFISISTSPVVTELDRMVAYDNSQTARSRVLSITWSRYISTYAMHNLTGWWFLILDHHAQSHMILWSCDHMCSLMTKNVISPIPPVLWAPNLTEWWLMTWGYTHKITPPLLKCFVLSYFFLPSHVPLFLRRAIIRLLLIVRE